MIETKKKFWGLYSIKTNTDTGITKYKILGITIKKTIKKQRTNIAQNYDINEIHVNIKQFYNFIVNNCKKDCYNLILHRHLGDSFVILCLKSYFEDKYGKSLHFFVKPRQELLMKIFNINSYTVFDITKILAIKDYVTENGITETQYIDKLEENIYTNLFPSIPMLHTPFICNPIDYIKIKCPYKNFIHGWSVMLGLDIEQVIPPNLHVELSKKLNDKLKDIDFSKIVCFAPEANSCKEINIEFWNILAEQLTKAGYYVIVNAVNQKNKIKFANYIDCSLYDFIAIAKFSKAVFTIRSGLADILANVQKKCYVFSTEEIYEDYFYMNKNFKLPYEIKEIRINTDVKRLKSKKMANKILEEF